MFRKLSAVMFMLVMALLITLKHPVLGYCICLDAYFTGDCVCETQKKESVSTLKNGESPHPQCCSNCITDESETDSSSATNNPSPCDDCTKHLNIDVDDFVWNASDQLPSDANDFPSLASNFSDQGAELPTTSVDTALPIRGDPPPELVQYDTDLPLYLRHSVLRL